MGFFDFFRSKRSKRPTLDLAQAGLKQTPSHNHVFVHRVLPVILRDDPLCYLGMLVSPDAHCVLAALMEMVCAECNEVEPDFSIDAISVRQIRIGPYLGMVLEMPAPQKAADAYFVAAVPLIPESNIRRAPKDVPLRYFVLELGMSVFTDEPRTFLCEWTPDGRHVNYGSGPAAQFDAFVRAVEEVVLKGQDPAVVFNPSS